ncbi:hypothetical protein VUR80DRAFT_155 [Thermomyces stellatus]
MEGEIEHGEEKEQSRWTAEAMRARAEVLSPLTCFFAVASAQGALTTCAVASRHAARSRPPEPNTGPPNARHRGSLRTPAYHAPWRPPLPWREWQEESAERMVGDGTTRWPDAAPCDTASTRLAPALPLLKRLPASSGWIRDVSAVVCWVLMGSRGRAASAARLPEWTATGAGVHAAL